MRWVDQTDSVDVAMENEIKRSVERIRQIHPQADAEELRYFLRRFGYEEAVIDAFLKADAAGDRGGERKKMPPEDAPESSDPDGNARD